MLDKKLLDYTGKDVIVVVGFLALVRFAYKGIASSTSPVEKMITHVSNYNERMRQRIVEDQ
jgi:hypothetical protein